MRRIRLNMQEMNVRSRNVPKKDISKHVHVCLHKGLVTYLILLKTLSRSFFISTRVRVWSKKRSFICCSLTLDSPLKLISISLVFSKRSSLFSQWFSKATIIFRSPFTKRTRQVSATMSCKSEICYIKQHTSIFIFNNTVITLHYITWSFITVFGRPWI